MQLILRWYGPDDPVRLAHIRQIPHVTGVATSLNGTLPGVAWASESIEARQALLSKHGLQWRVAESIPIHEDIKLGCPAREGKIDAWCETLVRLGKAGVPVVCYNFMPIFDWMRTDLHVVAPDGTVSTEYRHRDLKQIDLSHGIEKLPAWSGSFDAESLRPLLAAYESIDAEQLWDHLAYFLDRVVPVAREANVRLGIHPDDPPWPIFGLPRIMTSAAAFERVLSLNDDPASGMTLCTGSLGASPENDLIEMIARFGPTGRIHYAHCRNVRRTGEKSFIEAAHPRAFGSVDLVGVVRALAESGFGGPMRPDHGRMIWDEVAIPGYGLHDRALGAMYLAGIWDSVGGAFT